MDSVSVLYVVDGAPFVIACVTLELAIRRTLVVSMITADRDGVPVGDVFSVCCAVAVVVLDVGPDLDAVTQ